jgi:RNA polymerase sigma factor (TIGR02999 family)
MPNDEVNGDITRVLESIEQRAGASEQLLPLVYDELVHEAWIRLFNGNARVWQSRGHFFGAAAEAMRRILIERARRKMSSKRGGRAEHVSIEDVDLADTLPDERVLLIDEALYRLEKRDQELARVVTLKFFGGLTNAEVADLMGVTERTVQNKWNFAKAWLTESILEETKGAS